MVKPFFKLIEKIEVLVEKKIDSSFITISDDLKKSVSWANIEPKVFMDQLTLPLFKFAFNKSPDELLATRSPFFDNASDKRFWDLINEEIVLTSQSTVPSFEFKQRSLLSWLIKYILFLKTFILDFKGIPWFFNQINLPVLKEIA